VVKGSRIIPSSLSGLSDPFCMFKAGEEEYRTPVAKRTLNPEWNGTFEIDGKKIMSTTGCLEFEVNTYINPVHNDYTCP
jgi:Ca2+-dependent lipid-binding protein